MPDVITETAPVETGNAKPVPVTLEKAYQTALDALDQESGKDKEQPVTIESAPEGSGNAPPVDEPEHIKWAKSVDGYVDKETGQIISDRIAKAAYETHKQTQAQAQRLNQLEQLMKHPEVSAALTKIINPQPAAKIVETVPETEKTDEEILEEWIQQQIEKQIEPLKNENQMLYQEYAQNIMTNTYTKLKDEFGNDEAGKPVYDSIKEDVARQLATAAKQANMPFETLWNELIRRGSLYETLSSTARNLLYPRMKEKITLLQSKKVEDKKRLNLPGKGTPVQSVNVVEKKIKSIMDAAKIAEADHPEFKELA